MNLTSDLILSGQSIFESSTTQLHALGARGTTRDGRVFRYAKAGGSDLVVGNVLQGPAELTDHDTLSVSAAAVGATSVSLTNGGTNALTANQYAGGWLVVDTTPGEGYAYAIDSHPAAATGATCVITLAKDTPIQVALTTSSKVTLVMNPYKGVIQSPVTTLTGPVVGVCVAVIGDGEYGWIGVEGTFPTLIAGTPGPGLGVVVPATAAGAVVVDGAASATPVIGVMQVTGVNGKILPVRWLLG
jgi:hypothetical protein